MVIRFCRWPAVIALLIASCGSSYAQAPDAAAATTSSDDSPYAELRSSKDRLTQQLAERYYNLVRAQEWSDATGKFKTIAKYVDHDPKMQWVELKINKGRGAAAQVRQIPVAKLSRTCQSRVRQIAMLQPKLDEMAAGGTADPGSPMTDEGGREPQDVSGPDAAIRSSRKRTRRATAPGISPPAQIQTSGEADPLGFSDLPPGPAMEAGGDNSFRFGGIGEAPGAPPPQEATRPRQAWEVDYEAFRTNFTSTQAEGGEASIDWGAMRALRALGKMTANPPEDDREVRAEEMAYMNAIKVNWEAPFQSMQETEPGIHSVAFDLQPLPPPLKLSFQLDKEGKRSSPEDWMRFAPREQVRFTGRFHMTGPTSIVIYVDEPQPAAAAPSPPR